MTQYLFANNPITTLAAPISASQTTCTVLGGTGSLFPSPGSGQAFTATLVKNGVPGTFEIVDVTNNASDTFTIVRAQESTVALTWNAGDTIANFITAASLNSYLQISVAQPELYTYATDVGSANNYSVVLTPSLLTLAVGQRYRFIAAHANTGNCLFNGSPLLLPTGAQVPAGIIAANGYYEAVYVGGAGYQLFGANAVSLVNAALTGVPTAPTAPVDTNTTQIATTQFVQGQIATDFKTGAFNCINGTTTTTFATAFPNVCTGVFVQWLYASTVGYVVANSYQAGTGFQYTNASAGLCIYLAVGN